MAQDEEERQIAEHHGASTAEQSYKPSSESVMPSAVTAREQNREDEEKMSRDAVEKISDDDQNFVGMTAEQVRERTRECLTKIEALPAKLSRLDVARVAVEALAPEIENAQQRGYSAGEAIAAADLPTTFGMPAYLFINAYRALKRARSDEGETPRPARAGRRSAPGKRTRKS